MQDKTRRTFRVVVKYAMKDTKGADSYVIVDVLKDQAMDNDTVNRIKSVYPLDTFIVRIRESARSGKLIVIDKSKADQMLAPIGVQPSERSSIVNLAKTIISHSTENVNRKKLNFFRNRRNASYL